MTVPSPPNPLDDRAEANPRWAVVGGAGAIGRALVVRGVAAGVRVAVLDLPQSLQGHGGGGAEHAIPLDATDETQVDQAFGELARAWPALDGLVILPGLLRRTQPVEAFSLADWREVVDVSLTSTFLCAKAALPLLRKAPSPAILTMASGLGVQPAPGYGPYAAAKAAVISLTRTLALELAPLIRVNAIAPGLVDTAFIRGGTGQPGVREDGSITAPPRPQALNPPLGRLATPEDLADTMMFLLGPSAALVTGQVWHVNGGALMP